MKFLLVGALASSIGAAQDGTCVAGVDPLNVWQQCLGRCHIFYAGDYGACGHQFSEADAKGPCGDTLANRCYSTFNAAWSDSRANCGNCYYVEMDYPDGTVTSTYLETVDTNGSETKFEMSEVAWVNLCPFACAGTGVCAHSPSLCENGLLPDNAMPAGCYVQSNTIRFKRVDCNGGTAPATSSPTTTTAAATTTTAATTTSMSTTSSAPTSTSATTKVSTTTSTLPGQGGNGNDAISQCHSMVGYPDLADWDTQCKEMCDFYGAPPQRPFCAYTTAAELAACVKRYASYCIVNY